MIAQFTVRMPALLIYLICLASTVVLHKAVDIPPLPGALLQGWVKHHDLFGWYKIMYLVGISPILIFFLFRFILVDFQSLKKFQVPLVLASLILLMGGASFLQARVPAFFLMGAPGVFYGFITEIVLVIVFLFVLFLPDHRDISRATENSIVSVATFASVLGILQYLGFNIHRDFIGPLVNLFGAGVNLDHYEMGNTEISSIFPSPGYFGLICIFGCLQSLPSMTKWTLKRDQYFKSAAFFLCGAGIYISGNKACWGAALAVLAMMFFLNPFRKLLVSALWRIPLVIILTAGLWLVRGEIHQRPCEARGTPQLCPKDYDAPKILEISESSGIFTLRTDEFEMKVSKFGDNYFLNYEGGKIPVHETVSGVRSLPSSLKDLQVNSYYSSGMEVMGVNYRGISFSIVEQGGRFYVYKNYRLISLVEAEKLLPTEYDGLISGRGYIWSRTFPLLESSLFIGQGYGHFPLVFPQNDFGARSNLFGIHNIIEGPHNAYLQKFFESGFMGMFVFVSLIVLPFFQFFRLQSRFRGRQGLMADLMCLLAGILVFMTLDLHISVAVVFWVILGKSTRISLRPERTYGGGLST